MTIGEIISYRRKELGLTLEDIGKAVGVGKSTVKKWESGYISNMRRDRIALLANVLQIDPSVLINAEKNGEIKLNSQNMTKNLFASVNIEHTAEAITDGLARLSNRDERDILMRLDFMLEELTTNGGALMFDGEPLDDESRELLVASLENSIRMAKLIAKQKYTPKKYRKGSADDQ